MIQNITHLITKLETELLALKTAHSRGLGLTDFYSKAASNTITPSQTERTTEATIISTTSDGDSSNNFEQLEIHATDNVAVEVIEYQQNANNKTWKLNVYNSTLDHRLDTLTLDARVISTSEISNLQVLFA